MTENPTSVVITDRNDLDDQLFGTFARCRDLLRQDPVQAADRADLREKLRVAGGGVVFTTIRKFVKRCLKRHGYPPDKQAKATITVLEKAEVLSEHWAAA